MKILVCGGRNFDDAMLLYQVLDKIHRHVAITHIIAGDATGADSLALYWANDRNIPKTCYIADWKSNGKAAGPIRNKQMLEENLDIEIVVAFAGGKGTTNMIRQAIAKGLRILGFNSSDCLMPTVTRR